MWVEFRGVEIKTALSLWRQRSEPGGVALARAVLPAEQRVRWAEGSRKGSPFGRKKNFHPGGVFSKPDFWTPQSTVENVWNVSRLFLNDGLGWLKV